MTKPPVTRAQAITDAGVFFAHVRRSIAETANAGGPEAVASQAWLPGGPSREELAAKYVRLHEQATRAEAA